MPWTHTLDRWLYRDGRPHAFARFLNHATAALSNSAMGRSRDVTLEVKGRRSGRTVSLPVVVADLGRDRSLVSMVGHDANWVKNVRANGEHAVLRHGRREPVQLVEVSTHDGPPIIRRYLQCAPGARPHIDRDAPPEDFERMAAAYPVNRIASPLSRRGK